MRITHCNYKLWSLAAHGKFRWLGTITYVNTSPGGDGFIIVVQPIKYWSQRIGRWLLNI